MSFRVRALVFVGLLVGCGADKHGTRDAGFGMDADMAPVEGEEVDVDGDGVPDGIDTDGDGVPDLPLADAAASLPDAGAPYPIDDAGMVLCGDTPCACSDGLDNDMDGLIDLLDPECVSTWDNDEGSLATGIPGDNRDEACQDCFFDGNSGSGDDGCRVPSSCITMGDPSSGRGNCNKCEQSEQCQRFCQSYTPNGCDCFGCCGIRVAGVTHNVLLSGSCKITGDTLDGCTSCVPSTTCVNECGKCELCPGKTLADLPPECGAQPDAGTPASDAGAPPVYTCDNGDALCGAGQPACPTGSLCQFGCCTRSPIVL